MTRNVSASGVYFETDVPLAAGGAVSFDVHFTGVPGGPLRMRCSARVVRVEPLVQGIGVGAAIEAFHVERE